MLFRPSFCANCGEKIERAEWGILTSRRFCQVCESEYKGHDLIPRAVVGLGLLIGVFGIGAYLKSGSVSDAHIVRQPAKLVSAAPVSNIANATPANVTPLATEPAKVNPTPTAKVRIETDETAYFCGAETKKGTPCSRRVKGNIRCFQHAGMPAMATRLSTK